MADKPKPKPLIHIAARRGIAEARRSFERDNDIRSDSKILLNPDDIAGEYDFSRELLTMLGGTPRRLTIDDLKQFSYLSTGIEKKFKKGITAKGVIDLSLKADRDRANEEIPTAVPIAHKAEEIRFMTNAGPNSDRNRHYVTVKLTNWMPVISGDIPLVKTGTFLSKSPLLISCDCGRWRFWLAYLATKGNFNSGYPEYSFPKIRNPTLSGVACKHILRVMALIHQSPFIKQYMTNMVKLAREKVDAKLEHERIANTREIEKKLKDESWKQRKIRTSDEKREARISKKARENAVEEIKKATKPKRTRKQSTKLNEATTEQLLQALIAQGLPKEIAEMNLKAMREKSK